MILGQIQLFALQLNQQRAMRKEEVATMKLIEGEVVDDKRLDMVHNEGG